MKKGYDIKKRQRLNKFSLVSFSSKEMKKRGQITIFIIVGILLLISIAIIIIFRQEITIFKPERVIPSEIAPLVIFGDNCLEQISNNALGLLGIQGGYIYLPSEIENNPQAHIDAGLKIPYWHYLAQNRVPSIPLMEAHLARYLEEHFNDCLQGFQPFQAEYDIIAQGPIKARAALGQKTTIFKVDYPIEIKTKDGTKINEFRDFQFTSPVQLKKVYEVAKSIMEKEAEEEKLEKTTMDLIALDPEIPLSGFELSCSPKVWQVDQVEKKLKTLLRTNLPSLRIEKTSYLKVPEDQPYIKNHYVWPVTELSYPDIQTSIFFSENKPWFMHVSPREGSILKSGQQKGADLASFVCMQMWKFTYSLKYPIIVTVEDTQNNYALNYAFDVQIKNNYPSRESFGSPAQFIIPETGSQQAYCSPANFYGDHLMKIFTYDNISEPGFPESHEPLNQVNISFTCLKYTCPMGQANFQAGQSLSLLQAQFPYCVNGIVRANKPSYQPAEEFVTTAPGREVHLYLTPLKIISNYKVVKHDLVNGVVQGSQPLASDETALITLTYLQNNTVRHSSSVSYPSVENAPHDLEPFYGGNFPYRLEIYLMDGNNLIGGYQGNWTPSWTELANAQEIEFPVLFIGEPASDQATIDFLNNLQKYSSSINPTIK